MQSLNRIVLPSFCFPFISLTVLSSDGPSLSFLFVKHGFFYAFHLSTRCLIRPSVAAHGNGVSQGFWLPPLYLSMRSSSRDPVCYRFCFSCLHEVFLLITCAWTYIWLFLYYSRSVFTPPLEKQFFRCPGSSAPVNYKYPFNATHCARRVEMVNGTKTVVPSVLYTMLVAFLQSWRCVCCGGCQRPLAVHGRCCQPRFKVAFLLRSHCSRPPTAVHRQTSSQVPCSFSVSFLFTLT